MAKAPLISLCTWKLYAVSALPSFGPVKWFRSAGDTATKAAWQLSYAQTVHHLVCRHNTKNGTLPKMPNSVANRPVRWMGLFVVWILTAALTIHVGHAAQQMRLENLMIASGSQKHKFSIEVARTGHQKSMGLMFRKSLAPDRGMLFPYADPQELTMWMRNTYIPLDMVFIKADGTIHRIAENTEPFSEEIVASQGDVTAVLELAGGVTRQLGIKAGDKVVHPHFTAN